MKKHNIQTHFPAEHPHAPALVVRISENGENISESVAHKLYDRYFLESTARNQVPEEFTPNYIYTLDNGVAFRLFDGDEGPEKLAIEMGADPYHERRKQDILADIPEVLRQAGIENEPVLGAIVARLASQQISL